FAAPAPVRSCSFPRSPVLPLRQCKWEQGPGCWSLHRSCSPDRTGWAEVSGDIVAPLATVRAGVEHLSGQEAQHITAAGFTIDVAESAPGALESTVPGPQRLGETQRLPHFGRTDSQEPLPSVLTDEVDEPCRGPVTRAAGIADNGNRERGQMNPLACALA